MCFLWQLGQRVIANHLMVLTFQQDRTVCSGSVFFFIYIYFARISKADQDCCLTYNCYLWPGLFCYYSQEGSCLFKTFWGYFSCENLAQFLGNMETCQGCEAVFKTCKTIFLFFFFLAVQVCFLTFITMVNDKGSFDTHKHMCKMCLCMQLIYKKKPLLHV